MTDTHQNVKVVGIQPHTPKDVKHLTIDVKYGRKNQYLFITEKIFTHIDLSDTTKSFPRVTC